MKIRGSWRLSLIFMRIDRNEGNKAKHNHDFQRDKKLNWWWRCGECEEYCWMSWRTFVMILKNKRSKRKKEDWGWPTSSGMMIVYIHWSTYEEVMYKKVQRFWMMMYIAQSYIYLALVKSVSWHFTGVYLLRIFPCLRVLRKYYNTFGWMFTFVTMVK